MGHALCFDVQRSSAYLMLGRSREVLKATDGCVAMGADHCLRTLPPILLRRAVAFEQLGLSDAADQAFREAFLLVRESRSLIGLLNLPALIVDRLWGRLGAAHPDYADSIDAIIAVSSRFPSSVDSSTDFSTFTTREITLASMLRNGAEPVEIANALFLSTNTVKVHLRNIYRKLGVHSRAEALAKIESAGVHSLPQRG
jgi:DNA-binding CsgD family transcriptional regulator